MQDNGLILELWAQLKSYIPVKERLEAADSLVTVFNNYGMITDSMFEEDLDKALKAAVTNCIGISEEEDVDGDNEYD